MKLFSNLYRRVFAKHDLVRLDEPLWRRVVSNWQRAVRRLLPLGGISEGNKVTLFHDGDDALADMCAAINGAKERVWLEMYIFEPDSVGRIILDALTHAAKRGCEVILLYDHFGSSRLSSGFLSPFLQAGGKSVAFNPIWPWRRKGPLLFRDHRKILVVDHGAAFCGSMNISKDYAGSGKGKSRFRDTVVKLEGPAVRDLADLFLATLTETTGEVRNQSFASFKEADGVLVQVLGSNTRKNLWAIQKSMEVILRSATRFCYFTTPYFLPYEPLRQAMVDAAKRGVDVRVLTAGLSDVPMMRFASQRVYGQFLEAGIRIYEMFGKTLHAKTATIDGIYGSVGSYNLDHWSARRNLEVNISIIDEKVARELEAQFFDDMKAAKEVTIGLWQKRSWFSQFLQWVAYQLMRL